MAPVTELADCLTSVNTERLSLETLTPDNMSESYAGWLRDKEVNQYLEVRHSPQTARSVTQYIKNMLNSPNDLLMGIFKRKEHKHIGNIRLGPVNWRYKRSDIGIIIGDKDSWGMGYATEAIKGICAIAYGDFSLERIQAGAYLSNKGSIKAFEKAGFKQEGICKAYWILDGVPEDHVIMGRLRE